MGNTVLQLYVTLEMTRSTCMKKNIIVLFAVLMISLSVYASPFKSMSATVYGGYQGLLSQEAVHGVGGGAHARMHFFSLPVFVYTDMNALWPFIRPSIDGERGANIMGMISLGAGWQFDLKENLALAVGAGGYFWTVFDMMSGHDGTTMHSQAAFGVEILTEVRYLLNDFIYLSCMFNPDFTILGLGGIIDKEDSRLTATRFDFQPQLKIGIGFQYGREI